MNKKITIIVLSVITAIALGVTVWAVWFRSPNVVLAPDYAPKDVESNVQQIGDNSDEKLDAPNGGGAVSLTYSKNVGISLKDKQAKLIFGNPTKSTQDMVLQIVIGETVVAQSGRISPGNQVTKLDLLKDAEKQLAIGGYDGKFVVLYYDQTTGEKAIVNTEIPLQITVTA